MEEHPEGAFQARSRESSSSSSSSSSSYKGKKPWLEKKEKWKKNAAKKKFTPCTHCKKSTHLEKYCWYKTDIQCRSCKQLGHIDKVARTRQKHNHSSRIKLRILRMFKLKRSMFSLPLVLQVRAKSKKIG
ncbi:hypothetical protein PVK06_026725 [Gossypium arboreum]|uniref:Uncharacterized protein n=1 Tax=Gossypium arboreum TaxID=29729 RepID=A0ABR0NYH0_GOSAR|nr:hypothetical protein PVK06_026725 [Gossypium arboreum]